MVPVSGSGHPGVHAVPDGGAGADTRDPGEDRIVRMHPDRKAGDLRDTIVAMSMPRIREAPGPSQQQANTGLGVGLVIWFSSWTFDMLSTPTRRGGLADVLERPVDRRYTSSIPDRSDDLGAVAPTGRALGYARGCCGFESHLLHSPLKPH